VPSIEKATDRQPSSMIADSLVFHGRVVLIGDASVGKTSILNRLLTDKFDELEPPTIGANYHNFTTDVDSFHVEIQIWDTAGQEKFRSLGPIYFRNSFGAVVVYDVNNKDSFDHLADWIATFSEVAGINTTIAIVGNKCDVAESRKIGTDEGREWAQGSGYLFFEASAKTGVGIPQIFEAMAVELVRTKNPGFDSKRQALASQESGGCC
jgi:small GTP-binding protein